MKKIIQLGLCTLAICFFSTTLALAAPTKIDGKSFEGVVGEKGDKKGDADTFTFDKGTFHSSACDQYGYTSAPYTEKDSKKGAHFSAKTKNNGGDTIAWNGTLNGDKIIGTAVRKTKSGEQHAMWFNGTLKK